MIGTIVNTITIILGSLLGSLFKKGIKQEYQGAMLTAMGLAATALGANAVVSNMPKSAFPVLFIVSLAIGTLSILGPIEAALNKNYTYLFTNATLDFVTSMVLASTYGVGITIAAAVLFCWQGAIYLFAGFLSAFLSPALLTEISIIGGILIASSGISILGIKDCKTMNMLPSLLVPVIWFLIRSFF